MLRPTQTTLLGFAALATSAVGVALGACGGDTGNGGSTTGTSHTTASTSSGTTGSGGENIFTNTGTGAGGTTTTSSASGGAGPGPACGDGKIDPGEACDDGNGDSGDGCTGTCDAIEKDFACPQPGKPCVSTVACGDGKITGDETCDDANPNGGDGCDADCHVEPGWKCLVVGAACTAAACGDGIVAGQEQCDDGNPNGGDGCSAGCQLETGWKCPTPGAACSPTVCGDGVAEGTEQCDDGNHDMGDGCTPFCVREPNCAAGACTSACGDGIKLPGGAEACDDGNTKPGDGCSASCVVEPGYVCDDVLFDPSTLDLPIVLRDFTPSHPDFEGPCCGSDNAITTGTLGPDGKPVYANPGGTTPMTTGQANFDQWYRDVPGVNITILQTLSLGKLGTGQYQFSSGAFFPIDGQGFGDYASSGHNFHFTSEVRYWFQYQGGEQLDFTGDDDVWVYVNKQKAVDLGGVHGAQSGSVLLDANAAQTYGLAVGSIYEIVVWQAERHTTASNYRLTLGQFTHYKSTCHSVCGDGIKTPDEVCDDGVNDGSYGHCAPGCQAFGPHCGDGIVQAGEECDDGTNLSPYGGCAPGCVKGAYCGDGKVDSAFGEQCDDGVNTGGYGKCDQGCVLGPYCGDGIVQAGEQCDDGNKVNFDGCNNDCSSSIPQ